MKKAILSNDQLKFLDLFGSSELAKYFYLTGGTALAEFYIPYRYSEDLDFFSEKEVNTADIITFLQTVKSKLGFSKFGYNTSFNRNIFNLQFPQYELKTEFTYFPFPQVEQPRRADGVYIDGILDIAVNKLFTIYQKPRSRDFIDLYMICDKYRFKIGDLIKKVRIKFDTSIDPIKLGSQFLLSRELKDYPRMLISLPEKNWQQFFLDEAKNLGKEILK